MKNSIKGLDMKELMSWERDQVVSLKTRAPNSTIKAHLEALEHLYKQEELEYYYNPKEHVISQKREQLHRKLFSLNELEVHQKQTKKNKPKNHQRICFKRAIHIRDVHEQIKRLRQELTELHKLDEKRLKV